MRARVELGTRRRSALAVPTAGNSCPCAKNGRVSFSPPDDDVVPCSLGIRDAESVVRLREGAAKMRFRFRFLDAGFERAQLRALRGSPTAVLPGPRRRAQREPACDVKLVIDAEQLLQLAEGDGPRRLRRLPFGPHAGQ